MTSFLKIGTLLASIGVLTASMSGCGLAGSDPSSTSRAGSYFVEYESARSLTPTRVRVEFPSGNPDCVEPHAIVEESSTEVAIGIRIDSISDGNGECALLGEFAHLVINLSRPLGNRKLVRLAQPEE